MKISQAVVTNEGYLKYSKLRQLAIDTVPKLILSKVFTYSDKRAEKFLKVLESLYENPLIKPMLDVVAVHIAKNDDFIIVYGATLPSGTNGRCTIPSNKNDTDGGSNLKKIEIQTHLTDEKLPVIIVHECGHFLADVIFANNGCAFRDEDFKQQTIYLNNLHSFALKFAQVLIPRMDEGIYSTLDGKQLLNFVFNRNMSLNDDSLLPCNAAWDEFNKLKIFFNSFLISTDHYNDGISKDAEIFARVIENFLSIKDSPNVAKLLGEFSDYYYQVVTPSIDEYMSSNKSFVDKLNIKPNELGSYGMKVGDFAKAWDKNEELYFAVVSGDNLKAKELMLDGADPSHIFFGMFKIINVVLKRDNLDLFKFIIENSKNIDFESKDLWNQTTFEIAKEAGEETYALIKDLDKKEEEVPEFIEIEYYPEILTQAEELHTPSEQLVTVQNMV